MFDKNEFKDHFRFWLEEHTNATLAEANLFCEVHIPVELQEKYHWLKAESLSWFVWLQDQRTLTEYSVFMTTNEESDEFLALSLKD